MGRQVGRDKSESWVKDRSGGNGAIKTPTTRCRRRKWKLADGLETVRRRRYAALARATRRPGSKRGLSLARDAGHIRHLRTSCVEVGSRECGASSCEHGCGPTDANDGASRTRGEAHARADMTPGDIWTRIRAAAPTRRRVSGVPRICQQPAGLSIHDQPCLASCKTDDACHDSMPVSRSVTSGLNRETQLGTRLPT